MELPDWMLRSDIWKKQGIDTIRAKEQALMKRFYEGIKEIPGVKIYGVSAAWTSLCGSEPEYQRIMTREKSVMHF